MQLLSTTGAVLDIDAGAGTDVGGTVALVNNAFTVPIASTPTATIGRVALVFSG